ncbi:MAG: 50S ribosomal protein L13 [Deltaproteobacteria bacterium]|nr:50S ribosomal protein L13 [Deltaproteobacteria bacterium]
MSSFYQKEKEVQPRFLIVDLKDQVLGRAATKIATMLKGKDLANYTPGVDMGTVVIAINADQVKLTGRKLDQKMYYRHTGYMGGLREINAKDQMKKDSTQIIFHAVKGMLARGPLGRAQLKKLKVYAGAEHPHSAQKPEAVALA